MAALIGIASARYNCPVHGLRLAITARPHQTGQSSSKALGTDSYQMDVASAAMVSPA